MQKWNKFDECYTRSLPLILISFHTYLPLFHLLAAGHQQQTIQIPPILTQLDLLQKQLLLQQQAQQIGQNAVNVGTNIPQVNSKLLRIGLKLFLI